MHLKQTTYKKTGRTNLSMVQSYYDKERRQSCSKTIKNFGFVDILEKTYPDPIAHFKKVVEEHNDKETKERADYVVTFKRGELLAPETSNRKNLGYAPILRIFYELGLDSFLQNRRIRNSKLEAPSNAIMKLLVISRILDPGSKKRAFENKGRYFDFEKDAFSLADVYRTLSHFATLEKDMQKLIHERISKQYGRQLELIYYDVTNYYFEIDKEDDLRKKGVCKSHTSNPIVQLGMAMDSEGIPISYEVFAGNESEKLHLRPTVLELKEKYIDSKIIAVADAAQNTGNNIYYLDKGKQGYVFSQSIRGGAKAFKEYVIAEKGYIWQGEDYKRKSRICRREIQVDFKRSDGSTYKKKILVDQRQIVFYSTKYAVRAKAKREAAILKAQKIANNPSAYTRATSYGALKYVKNVEVDKQTGEVKPSGGTPLLNYDAIREEEKYDGYYCIVTNLFDEGKGKYTDEKIIDIYRGLWRIEDSFRVTKSDLETRPIHLTREERIRAHFLVCFISLVIVRLIQKRIGGGYSAASLIDAMNKISCSHAGENLFLFDFRNKTSDELGKAFNLDFTRQVLSRAEIKNILAQCKKV